MKILRLDLLAFGPFTDTRLDLSAGCQGLHLIYGPNEAGKSSALRALRRLFYGIPERTSDDFTHAYNKLRIGAILRHSDGSELAVTRRKGRGETLRGSDERTVIPQEELNRYLDGVDQRLFETWFGIDHKELVQGGEEIGKGGGQLGQVLFAASAGISRLRNTQDQLRKDMNELFVPRGQNPKINATLRELERALAQSRAAQLSSDEWERHDHALRQAEHSKERLEADRQRLNREYKRLARIDSALPSLPKRQALLTRLAEYHDAPLLTEDFGERWRAALNGLRLAEHQAEQAQRELARLEAELSQRQPPAELLNQAPVIEQLQQRLGEYRKALADKPRLVAFLQKEEHQAHEILGDLGRSPDLSQAESLRLAPDEEVRIGNLGNQYQALIQSLDSSRQEVVKISQRIDQTRRELAALPTVPDTIELIWTLREAQREGDLEQRRDELRGNLRDLDARTAIDLRRLPLWSGTLEDLEQLAVPPPATIDRFDEEHDRLHHLSRQLDDRLGEVETRLRELAAEIDQLDQQGEVPSEHDLTHARQQRDSGWRLARRAWQEGIVGDAAEQDFIGSFPGSADLAAAYERSVERADQLADRLRREADRVARRAHLSADLRQHQEQRHRLERQRAENAEQLERLTRDWEDLWRRLFVTPLPPREMRGWLTQHAELRQQAQTQREQRQQLELIEQRIDALIEQTRGALEKLGETAPARASSLALLLTYGQERVEYFQQVKTSRIDLERVLAQLEQDERDAQRDAQRAEAALATWREQWGQALERLGLTPETTPAEVQAVLVEIQKFWQHYREADGLRRRLEGIDRDACRFREDVEELARHVALYKADLSAERLTEELQAALTQARAQAQEYTDLRRQHDRETERQRQALEDRAIHHAKLQALCQEAGCAVYEELPQAEQRAARRRQLDHDLRQLDEQLLLLSGGQPLAEFITEASQVDSDDLKEQLRHLDQRLRELHEEISKLDQTIGSARAELARMDGSACAAEEAEQAEHLLAQLHEDVSHYARLHLAATMLREGIERFRRKSEGAVLDRASALFAALTAGSFAGLRIEHDDNHEPVMLGVRPGGPETVPVTGMSDGSRDQLYLALRLASLEAYFHNHEPLPFIVDDVLLNFDNRRAEATLQALADLSRLTQVIFFTHHEHLIPLAEQALPSDVLFVHHLPGRKG
ncbi:MAG: AAA family ATPase [Gemmataceae bacterium]